MPKDQFIAVLRQRIRDDNTFGVVHICQAWAYLPKHPNDHTYRQILAGEMSVPDLKRGDKTEALIVRYECQDGSQRMWISPIVRPKTGGVALGDALEMGEMAEGRFASLFDGQRATAEAVTVVGLGRGSSESHRRVRGLSTY